MRTFNQLRKAIEENKPLIWNDPDKIKGADYKITFIEDVSDFEHSDTPVLIQYNGGYSEAQVYLSEIQELKH